MTSTSNRVSLNVRLAQEDVVDENVYAALFEISHPEMTGGVVRLSTDNKDIISREPYVMGTRSTWRGANPITEPFLWVVASVVYPSDIQSQPAQAQVVLENVSSKIVEILRSFVETATVNMCVISASTPNTPEREFIDLLLTSASGNTVEIALSISRDEKEQEYYPPGRMTRNFFPGLFI